MRFSARVNEKSVIQKATPEQLRLCMLAAERIRCNRETGAIFLRGNGYYSPAVAALAGQEVVIRFDPARLHDSIFVYSLDGRYLDEVPCAAKVGFADADAARTHNRKRRTATKLYKRIAKDAVSFTPEELARMMPKTAEPAQPEGKVVRLFNTSIEALPQPAVKQKAEVEPPPMTEEEAREIFGEPRGDRGVRVIRR